MSNLSKATFVLALSILSTNAMADWQTDATHFDSDTQAAVSGTGSTISTSTAIPKVIAELKQYQPPAPCIDKKQETFDVKTGTPAALSCGGSGGASGGPSTPGYVEPLDQTKDDGTGTFR